MNKLLQVLKITENCISCEENLDFGRFYKSIDKIENCLADLEVGTGCMKSG